jgi:hypothetical protein
MRGASFRDLAGAELEPEDVERMLELDETLFVEHKGAEPEYQLAKAVADCDRLAEHVHHIQPIERRRALLVLELTLALQAAPFSIAPPAGEGSVR